MLYNTKLENIHYVNPLTLDTLEDYTEVTSW